MTPAGHAPAQAAENTPSGRALSYLRSLPGPLFVLLDAARAPEAPLLLRQSGSLHQSLYEGREGERLAAFAPYLAALPPDSGLMESLVRRGWGQSWGVFLASAAEFAVLRRHFRRFLMVDDEQGRRLYFRFYDPRVLRTFLPSSKPEEAREFFGPLSAFYIEGPDPASLWVLRGGAEGCRREIVPLVPGEGS